MDMKNSDKEKYLGDYVTSQGNSNETLIARKVRAYAILSEIRALLQDIPLGSRRVEIGLALRDAWFINGILFNSEVWGSYSEKHVEELEVIDHMILRSILGAQAKVAVETLYLETGTMSIKSVISVRRMLYIKNILSRHKDEIIRKVYFAMKEKPYKGDWYNQVKSDFQKYGIEMNERLIEEMDLATFKNKIKKSVSNTFFNEMQTLKLSHKKVKNIHYKETRKPQPYLTNPRFNNEMCALLFNLRCESTNSFKDNFHTLYGKTPMCKCEKSVDSQKHALICELVKKELTEHEQNVQYSDPFGSEDQQYNIVKTFQRILKIRASFNTIDKGLPGPQNSGPD